jgi:hypothetical protein
MGEGQHPTFEELLQKEGIEALSNQGLFERIGLLIDFSQDPLHEFGIVRALDFADLLEARALTETEKALLHYFRSNAHANARKIHLAKLNVTWLWDEPHRGDSILQLRRALTSAGFPSLAQLRQTQILTNLGNEMNGAGRLVDAGEYWRRALQIEPTFWMARGNLGYAQFYYAQSLYDPGHRAVMLWTAHRNLASAVELAEKYPDLGYQEARGAFERFAKLIEGGANLDLIAQSADLDGHSLGETPDERDYRNWCLEERLFLNPLNDIGPHSIAAQDVMTLPSFVTELDEPPVFTGFFNQMKQEFASARWLYYEGTRREDTTHFSDLGVRLYNTLDYPAYGLKVEKVKLAFKASYSIFDKIAYFLNAYFKQGIPQNAVNFNAVWRVKSGKAIRPEFVQDVNWPLRGLYYISKDFFEPGVKEHTEPDAQAVNELRNHLEHKYVKVHEMLLDRAGAFDPFKDTLAYSITRDNLEQKSLRLLKQARSGLIHLSLAMHWEERRRATGRTGYNATMPLQIWDDEWKQ